MSLEQYLSEWLETYIIPFRAPNTVECYRRAITSLSGELGGRLLADVDGLSLQKAINAQAAVHPRTAQLTYATLHAALAKAVRLHLLPFSPMEACDRPHHEAAVSGILDADQLKVYLHHAQASMAWPLLLLIATLGLRRGEALGLRWQDIDGQVLHVRHQRIKGELCPLKSKASKRDLLLPDVVLRALSDWNLRSISGYLVDCWPKRLYNEHCGVLQAANLPHVTLHGLRHSFATATVSYGAPIKVVQSILGHASYKITADLYANHMTDVRYSAGVIEKLAQTVMM